MRVAATAETRIAEAEAEAAKAAERREAARERLEKIKRGESLNGGLGKRPDLRAMLKSMVTPDQFRLVELSAKVNLTDAEFATMVAHSVRPGIAAGDKGPCSRAPPNHTGAGIA